MNGKNLSARQQLTECWKGLGECMGAVLKSYSSVSSILL